MNAAHVFCATIPMRTVSAMNAREHWRMRSARVKAERQAVALVLRGSPPETPCTVTLTRIAPSNGLDDDNLCSALKAARDQVAQWIGVDDRKRDVVRYRYEQQRGKDYAVQVVVMGGISA